MPDKSTEINKYAPYIPMKKDLVPMLYGDVPSFLRSPIARCPEDLREYDYAILGVPWEGALTWGGSTGCIQAPNVIRQVSLRYGGYIPELDINLLDYVKLCDFGNVDVCHGNVHETFRRIEESVKCIIENNSKPISLGGDHSIAYPIVKAISECNPRKNIGVVHFDSHFDNLDDFLGDRLSRCSPIRRISELKNVNPEHIIQIGIRGPRNSQYAAEFAKKAGIKFYTILDIRRRGINTIMDEVLKRLEDVNIIYMTVCMNVLDVAHAPGAALDPMGLTSYEMLQASYEIGKAGLYALDIVELYPPTDINNITAHMATWIILYALAGVAASKIEK